MGYAQACSSGGSMNLATRITLRENGLKIRETDNRSLKIIQINSQTLYRIGNYMHRLI
jgi:hypothetical protein